MKCAIVGCGVIGKVHAEVIMRQSIAQLVAVVDCNPQRAESFATQYHAKFYEDLEQMLATEQIDVLHICTPHDLHVPMTVMALEHGVHVFVEKPPVISFDQWQKLKSVVEQYQNQWKVGFCFQNRYNASIQYVKEQLGKETYGKLLGARAVVTWKRDLNYYKQSPWRAKWNRAYGGVLMNQSIHTLDLMQYLIGEKPQSVKASMTNHQFPESVEVEDTMEARIQYENLVACFYATTGYCKDKKPIIELEFETASVRIEEDEVTIDCDGQKTKTVFPTMQHLGKDCYGSGHLLAIRDFYMSILVHKDYPIELKSIEDTIWLVLNCYKEAGRKEDEE